MSIDRFHPFSDSELHELRHGVILAGQANANAGRPECTAECQMLSDEIGHVQEQRRMAAARERNPA